MRRILSIGECMIELTHRDADTLSLSRAGDTFNTATYLARLTTVDELAVDYLAKVGRRPLQRAGARRDACRRRGGRS